MDDIMYSNNKTQIFRLFDVQERKTNINTLFRMEELCLSEPKFLMFVKL